MSNKQVYGIRIETDQEGLHILQDVLKSEGAHIEVTQRHNLSGDVSPLIALVDITHSLVPVFSGLIAALAYVKTRRSIKINGIEIKGLSPSEIIRVLEVLQKEDSNSATRNDPPT